MAAARIVMFTDGDTHADGLAREAMIAHGLRWIERNTREDADAAAFVRQLCGAPVSPVLYVNGRWLPDPTQEELLIAANVPAQGSTLQSVGQTVFDVVVIGLGPSGLAACHGARLGGQAVLGLDQDEPGGHLLPLKEVSEYLGVGFDEAVPGEDIAANFAEHARHVGAVLMQGKVNSVRIQGVFKQVHSSTGSFWARVIVVATGAMERSLRIQGVEKYLNRGVLYGSQVNAALYSDRRVAVVGGGDDAFHAAIFLSQRAEFVTLLCPDDEPSAEPSLVERAVGNRVRIIRGSEVVAVNGDDTLDFLFFREKGIDEEQGIPVDAMVIAPGPSPREPIPGLERLPRDNGYFAHSEGGKTMHSGIYVVGDCTNMETRTLMSVVASGSQCAKRLWQWLAANPLPRL